MAEKFNLTWNDFQTNVTRSFTQLRQETDLCDVTLISDDQTQVQAHRVVLSTCSEFFRSIFKRNNHSNLVLYLSDITGTDLNIIMDYVYCGEVQIYQDRLDSFLGIAQKLKLEGLLAQNNKTNSYQSTLSVKEETVMNQDFDDIYRSQIKESDSNSSIIKKVATLDNLNCQLNLSGPMDYEELDRKIKEMTENDGDQCLCKICGKVSTGKDRRSVMAAHIETHLKGISYDCQQCGKVFSSRNSYRVHKSKNHKI